MKQITKISLGLIVAFTMLNSCTKEFLDKKPKGVANIESLDPQSLLIGAYASMSGGSSTTNQNYSGAASVRNWAWDCASDDAYKGTSAGDTKEVEEIEQYIAPATNPWIYGKWFVGYDGISRANDVLKALALKRNNMDEKEALQIEAQARFIRAWWHFRLQQMYWQIPYITDSVADPAKVKNDHLVWPEIENDFQFAINNLPDKWPGEPGKATKWAAMGYQAYVYLFDKKYSNAKSLLDDIITSGRFDLVSNFKDNYTVETENNKESLFEIQSAVNDGDDRPRNGNPDSWVTNPSNRYLPTCCGLYQPSQDLVNAFKVNLDGLPLLGIIGPKYNEVNLENDMGLSSNQEFVPTDQLVDPRLDWTVGRRGIPYLDWGVQTGADWIRSQPYGGPYNNQKQMFYKFDRAIASDANFARATAINFRALRYAHILLWRAECAVEENDLQTALDLINKVRKRASNVVVMGNVSTHIFDGRTINVDYSKPAANYLVGEYNSFPNQEYARDAVRMEERLEFAMEGFRFFDLVRWNIADKVLNEYIQNESKFRPLMQGTQFIKSKNDHWPIPQTQIDLEPGILEQDPNY